MMEGLENSGEVKTGQYLFYSCIKEEPAEYSLDLTSALSSSGIKEEPGEVDVDRVAGSSQFVAVSLTFDETTVDSRVSSNMGNDRSRWETQETEADHLFRFGVKLEPAEEQETFSPDTTHAFVSVDVDRDFKMEEPALSAVDPLLLSCLKTEYADMTEASTNVEEEEIESDPLQKEMLICEMCKKKFISQDDLNQHVSMNNCVPRYTCNTCGLHFRRRVVFTAHLEGHAVAGRSVSAHCSGSSGRNISDYRGGDCGEQVSSASLESYEAQQPAEGCFVCQECGKVYVDEFDLKVHQLRHAGYNVNTFACDGQTRNERFATDGALNKYKPIRSAGPQPIHSAEPKHIRSAEPSPQELSCDKCDFRCKGHRRLKIHMQLHREIFCCVVCGYRSLRQSDFEEHMEASKLGCDVCDYRSQCHGEFYKHMQGHTMLSCGVCGYQSPRPGEIKNHMVLVHPQVND